MASYHSFVTHAVTFNPYLPAIGRVLDILRSYGPAGTTIDITDQALAAAAHCTPTQIPALLRRLARDARIARTQTDTGTCIEVLQ